jgi:uncharacterized protein (UPF0335 family)
MLGSNIRGEVLEVVEKVERLIVQRKSINADISTVLAIAKGQGLDVKTLREMLKLRALSPEEREEREFLRDAYASALDLV